MLIPIPWWYQEQAIYSFSYFEQWDYVLWQVNGDLIAPTDNSLWNQQNRYWLQFKSVNGLTVNGGGRLDGQGASWWNNICKENQQVAIKLSVARSIMCSFEVIWIAYFSKHPHPRNSCTDWNTLSAVFCCAVQTRACGIGSSPFSHMNLSV